MGHDIYGIRVLDRVVEPIAYLRYAAMNPAARVVYDALECSDCYAHVSGNGSIREFDLEKLERAARRLRELNTFEQLKAFRVDPHVEQMLDGVVDELVAQAAAETGVDPSEVKVVRGGADQPPDLYSAIEFVDVLVAVAQQRGNVSVFFN